MSWYFAWTKLEPISKYYYALYFKIKHKANMGKDSGKCQTHDLPLNIHQCQNVVRANVVPKETLLFSNTQSNCSTPCNKNMYETYRFLLLLAKGNFLFRRPKESFLFFILFSSHSQTKPENLNTKNVKWNVSPWTTLENASRTYLEENFFSIPIRTRFLLKTSRLENWVCL